MNVPDWGWLEESTILIAILDHSLTCRALSQYWCRQLGLAELGAAGAPLDTLFSDGDNAEFRRELENVLHDGERLQDRHVEFPGENGPRSGRLSVWRAEYGTNKGHFLVVLVADSTELETAIRDLTEVQTEHQLILDAAGEGIYGLDQNGNTTFGNAAAEDILGWSVDDIRMQRAHDVHHHSYEDGSPYPLENCPIYAALHDGEVHRVDCEVFWHTNGESVPVEYTSTPILKDGKPNGAVVVFRDISARRKIQKQREDAYAEIKMLKEQLELERDYLRDEVDVRVNFGEIIGQSMALKRTLAKVEAVASTSASVLILGESGVGKEMIARAIHNQSERADKPLIKVNCASIPKDLFESEFFGHVRGAFTGAHKDRIGRLQLANGGTLFLDEVGEIPMSLQGKLLRALQEQQFERVGDEKTTTVDVRVVAATNRNLEEEMAAGRFREDLYYRLSVFPMELPPLRERAEDIVPLAAHFLEAICLELNRDTLALTKHHCAMLQKHLWPGNIRELRNVIERAVILTRGERLRLDLAMGSATKANTEPEAPASDAQQFLTEEEFRRKEKQNLVAALQSADWRVWGPDGAAALLGIKPSTLSYRMDAFDIRKG
ncbi:MAG: sigma 54-interacting transcriptional regulator [Proteobacteria bacterium]|nr:sigma 54-interacting transcriptional regulator [Pseudomonadota bacterium]